MREVLLVDLSALRERDGEIVRRSHVVPLLQEENDERGGEELLQPRDSSIPVNAITLSRTWTSSYADDRRWGRPQDRHSRPQ